MRRLPQSIPAMTDLGLPPVFHEVARERHGLVLITGGTGTGKSNSLARARGRGQRRARRAHRHSRRSGGIRARAQEGRGQPARAAHGFRLLRLRPARGPCARHPRSSWSGRSATAKPWRLRSRRRARAISVLATLHTSDAGTTISRVLGLFEQHEERLVRMRLAESLRYVISQRLLPRIAGGRVAAFEILRNTLRVRELVLQGEQGGKSFYEVLEEGGTHGMNTFDQSLFALFEQGSIDEDTALLAASDRARLVRLLDRLKNSRGESCQRPSPFRDRRRPGRGPALKSPEAARLAPLATCCAEKKSEWKNGGQEAGTGKDRPLVAGSVRVLVAESSRCGRVRPPWPGRALRRSQPPRSRNRRPGAEPGWLCPC